LPSRLQVKREKGFRLPPNTIYVGRPTKWGNPFRPGAGLTRAQIIARYRAYLRGTPSLMKALPELRGKNLACWCKPEWPCHADVLLELANSKRARRKA
jgi:Domain of unknown function (DUF4326)